MCVCVYVQLPHACGYPQRRDQKRASEPQELELQVVEGHLRWVLGIKL